MSRPKRDVRHLIVGLDFGTHSTKCVIRPYGAPSAALLSFDSPENNGRYAWFTDPSLVRIADGRLFFGRKSLQLGGGTLFRSLKIELLPPSDSDSTDDHNYPAGTGPDLFIACYLSRVLRIVRRSIERAYGGEDTKVVLNVGAPMDHFEQKNEALKIRYLQIMNAAWQTVFGDSSFDVTSGTTLDEIQSRFSDLLERNVEDATTRQFDILPETVAPIVSMSLDPRTEPGFYLMLDMGAGTTESSVNLLHGRGSERKVVCYFDQTKRIGGDDFEFAEGRFPDEDSRRGAINELVNQVIRGLRETCWMGFEKDKENSGMRAAWKRIHLLLTGGAARRPTIENAVRQFLPLEPHVPGEERFSASWHEPELGNRLRDLASRDLSLLAVANGLSIHRRQWPTVFKPDSVEPLEGDAVVEKVDPFWYV